MSGQQCMVRREGAGAAPAPVAQRRHAPALRRPWTLAHLVRWTGAIEPRRSIVMAVTPLQEHDTAGVFTAGQASRLSGVSLHKLAYWAISDFVTPSAQEAHRTGTRRGYTFRDIVQLHVAKRLRDAGLSLQALRKVQTRLQQAQAPETPFGDTYLVTNGWYLFEVKQG